MMFGGARKDTRMQENQGTGGAAHFLSGRSSDVRKQKGSFGKAFAKHEENMKENMEKVHIWRKPYLKLGIYLAGIHEISSFLIFLKILKISNNLGYCTPSTPERYWDALKRDGRGKRSPVLNCSLEK